MSNLIVPSFVGLDYHQDSVQVCVLDRSGKVLANRSVANDAQTVSHVCTQHGKPERISVEACCGSANLADELINNWQLPVCLAHPGYVNRMKQSPDKTDFSDARLLADLARVDYIPRVWLAPEETRQLRRLVRHRRQLVDRRKAIKLRIRALLRENRLKCSDTRAWTQPWYAWLTEQAELRPSDRWVLEDHLEELASLAGRIATAEVRIRQSIKDDPVVARLLEEKGVGLITAVTMRAEIGRFDRFQTGKQLARFCSVTPRNASSGNRQADAGLIRAGNPDLRIVLVELAHRLIRMPGKWGRLAAQMLKRGKRKNVVVAAVANRWVRWLYHEMARFNANLATSAPAQQKGAAPSALTAAST